MQYFYIKQGSTLPTLRMELIEDGRHDFNKFHECIQAADITFTMTNIDTNVVKVAKNAQTSVHPRTDMNVGPMPDLPKDRRFLKFSNPTHVKRFVGGRCVLS